MPNLRAVVTCVRDKFSVPSLRSSQQKSSSTHDPDDLTNRSSRDGVRIYILSARADHLEGEDLPAEKLFPDGL
jgi:hypothetical protein